MSIRIKVSELITEKGNNKELIKELTEQLGLLAKEYPGYSYRIEEDLIANSITVKSVNLMEHSN